MAEIARGDVEILVRAGASSRAQDDARHRAFVEAYLAFEPATRQRLDDVDMPPEVDNQIDSQAGSQLQQELAHSTQDEERESTKSYRPDNEDSDYGTSGSMLELLSQDLDLDSQSQVRPPLYSPSLSFKSVLHNVDSPAFHGPTICAGAPSPSTEHRISPASSASWGTPRSVIPDSQPEIQVQMPSSSQRSEIYLESFERTIREEKVADRGQQEIEANRALVEGNRALATGKLRDLPATSPTPKEAQTSSPAAHPMSRSPSKTPTRDPRRILQSLENVPSSRDTTVIGVKRKLEDIEEEGSTNPSVPKLVQSTSFPLSLPSSKLPKLQVTDRPSSQPEPRARVSSSNPTDVATSSSGSAISPWASKLYIRASPPATSRGPLTPEMLITQPLVNIVKKMSPDIAFLPKVKTRELRGMERGYWLVETKAWNDGLRARSWDMLANFIGGDMAGWGVACERREDHASLRVYCWGVIVEHVYYLLYLASEGKIKLGSADWIGGDGVAIIKMP